MTQSQVELHRLLMGQTDPPKITCVRYFIKSIVILEKIELCENLTDAQSPLLGSAVAQW